MTSISFIIPSYNESKKILKTINEITQAIKKINIKKYEIIVIDDNSTDSTLKILKNTKIKNLIIYKNKNNLGFGGSIKKGFKLAKNKKISWIPGDNSHPHKEIEKILNDYKLNLDIVSTYYSNSNQRAFYRKVFTLIYTPILNMIFCLNLPYYNGISLIDKKITDQIKIKTNSHCWQVELWVKAKYIKNFSYKFIPTILNDRIKGASAFKLKNSIKVLVNIVRLFFLNLFMTIKLKFFN